MLKQIRECNQVNFDPIYEKLITCSFHLHDMVNICSRAGLGMDDGFAAAMVMATVYTDRQIKAVEEVKSEKERLLKLESKIKIFMKKNSSYFWSENTQSMLKDKFKEINIERSIISIT